MPTTTLSLISILSHPCLSGLALRPRRLFGFDGTADGDPCPPTGLVSLRCCGLPSATAAVAIPQADKAKLQGGPKGRTRGPPHGKNPVAPSSPRLEIIRPMPHPGKMPRHESPGVLQCPTAIGEMRIPE